MTCRAWQSTARTGIQFDLEIGPLIGRERDLVDARTQRLSRLHVAIFSGPERSLDLTPKGPRHLLSQFVSPAERLNARPIRELAPEAFANRAPHRARLR